MGSNPKSKIQNPKSEIRNPNPKFQNPKSKIRNPKSKIQTGPFGAATKRTKIKLIQNPNPKSEIQNPKSEIQNPKSKRAVWSLAFGFGRAGTGGDGHVANEDVWPCWPPEFGLVGGAQACNRKQPFGCRLDSPHERPKLGTDFRRRGFAGNRGSISSPVFGNWGPISGETANQAVLFETLG